MIVDALRRLRPGAEWHLVGADYAGLTWLDKVQAKPSEAEVLAEIAAIEVEPAPSKADEAEAVVRESLVYLALGRLATGDDTLDEAGLVALIRAKLS